MRRTRLRRGNLALAPPGRFSRMAPRFRKQLPHPLGTTPASVLRKTALRPEHQSFWFVFFFWRRIECRRTKLDLTDAKGR